MEPFKAGQLSCDLGAFNRARRRFYRASPRIGNNDELARLFPAIGMHIIDAQFRSARLREIRIADYSAIRDAVVARDADAAEAIAREHVGHVRRLILGLALDPRPWT